MITRFARLSVPMPYPLPVAGGLSERQLAFVEVDGCKRSGGRFFIAAAVVDVREDLSD